MILHSRKTEPEREYFVSSFGIVPTFCVYIPTLATICDNMRHYAKEPPQIRNVRTERECYFFRTKSKQKNRGRSGPNKKTDKPAFYLLHQCNFYIFCSEVSADHERECCFILWECPQLRTEEPRQIIRAGMDERKTRAKRKNRRNEPNGNG